MCFFSFGSLFADFGRCLIECYNALHSIRCFVSPSRTVAGYRALHRLRRSLAALLLSLPLLFGLTVPDDAYAQTCNVSTAITDAEGAFGHHRQGGKGLPVATATYRALIALGDTSLPTWSGSNISGAAPTTPISEAGLRTVLTSQNELGSNHWAGWTRILTALNCLEAALPAVTIAAVGAVVTEGAGARFRVTVSAAQSSALKVNLNVADPDGSDFVASRYEGTQTVTIPVNETSAVHTVPTVNDKIDEAHGDVTVTVAGGSGYKLGSSSTAMVTVNDNDEPSAADQVQMKNATRKVAEFGNDKGDARGLRVVVEIGDEASLNGSLRTIKYTIDDDSTADQGSDANDPKDYYIDGCTSSTCSVELPANRHSAVITIYVNNDGLDEGDETIILTLTSGNGYTLPPVNKRTTTVTINDDDTRGLTFYRKWPDVQEGGSETLTVKLASQPTEPVEISIVSNNSDVTTTPTSLLFNPTSDVRWDTAQTVTVHAAHDSDAVNDEAILTYTTSGGDYGGANALSIDRPVSVDDDETADPITSNLPRISLTGGADVTEGAAASFTVNAAPAPTARLTVNVEVIEPPGQDFVAASEERVRTVTLNAGATSATFTVPTVNDSTDEADGVVQVYVNDGTGYIAGQGATVDVKDDDGPAQPAASFNIASSSAAEDAGTRNLTVNLSSAAPSGGLTLNYSVTGTARAGSGNDFTIQGSGSLSIAAGATSADIPVAIIDDSSAENAETVILTLTGGAGYTVGSPSVHTLTITDNDSTSAQPSVTFAAGSSSAAEDDGTHNVTVNISPAPSGGLTLSYSVTGTATAGSGNDFTIQGSGSLTVVSGATTATIPVLINDDRTNENAETVILTLTGSTGYKLGSTTVHTLTINDNDGTPPTTPAASFASASSSVGENTGTRNVRVNLSQEAPSDGLTLGYSVTGTATAGNGNDFTIQNSGSLTIAAGATSADIPVAIIDDSSAENAETVILTLTGGTGYTVGSTSIHTLTITDNDGTTPTTPSASFASGLSTAPEDAGTRNVTVNISPAPSGGFTLGYSVSGTATAGSGNDFTIQRSGTVTVAPGATTATIPVVINDDSASENAETVILTLTSGTGYTRGSPTVHTLTITDNDGGQPSPIQPSITIRADIASVEEGTPAGFTVLASPAPTSDLTISLRVSETTAEGQDYIAISDEGTHTITLNADTTSARYAVPTKDNTTEEPDGRVTVVVESGLDYSVSSTSASASVTIADNDGHEISFASDIGQIREGGVHTISVHIDPATTSPLTLRYRLSGTATLEEDYRVQTPGVVQVPAGKSEALILIESIADEVDESRETVVLTLEKGSGLTIGTSRTHELTLIDAREASLEAGWSWLVRFGRTVAQQVVDSISQRLRATRIEGTQVNVAGAQLPVGQSRAFGTFEPPTTNRPIDDFDTHSQISAQGSTQTLSEREVIQSSSFMSGSETDAEGGNLVVWGQASHSSFEGREKDLSLDGDSTSVILGADYAQQFWQAGATLILSEGKGDYRDEDVSGEVEASLTSIVPWAAVQATERVQLWGALGTGDGDLQLTEEESDTLKTNIDWSMAAAGLRSVLVPASAEYGVQLSFVGDALWVETKADPIEGLSIADAEASRLRLGLEGQHSMDVSSGAEVISRLEFGLRKDSGDAETGDGIEVGGGVTWSDARRGLTIELAGHKLLTYDADELEDEGFSLSFDYDPVPDSAEGLSLSLNQEVGVRAKDGLEAVFGSEPLATRTDGEKENRMRLEAAYGVPVLGGRFIGSPHMGLGLATGSREYSLGWKVTPERHAPDLSFGVRATRTESDALVPAHAIRFETVFRW